MIQQTQVEPSLAAMIDHTILKADATISEIEQLCAEALQYRFATVCVHPCHVARAAELLNSEVGITTVVGFPLGASTSAAKAYEAEQAIREGATEIDMVLNIGLLKSGQVAAVEADIVAVAAVCRERAILKVILETCLLTDEEIETACRLVVQAGADFVKTSTGFGQAGATEHHLTLMRSVVGPNIGVKASGGIRDRATALQMVAAGANRIGASASVAIVTE
ncbi:deoxyribose-phosphate aldolase [Paenibacillus yanchengensis]|uniref:Deoxyribose-phosphate aldolase n=1 Tax=Paenibacillus yanchengensis TaxID=2035833 RepID=A0ABW4YGE3_9BACL